MLFGLLLLVDLLLFRDALAGLIAYGAARFAGGLTGASALAATDYLFLLRLRNGLDHSGSPVRFFLLYTRTGNFASIFSRFA